MAMSGMITFVLLVVLIDCLNGQNIPTHPEPLVIKTTGRAARITCEVDPSTLRSNPLHWYRVQSGGAFQRLMYFEAGKNKPIIDEGVPRRYAGSVSGKKVALTISTLQFDDAGSYYCALWTDNTEAKKVFGSGTRLYVTGPGGDNTIPPVLSAYLPSVKSSDKQTMVCQASGMFPDLVKFTWKKKGNTGEWTDVSAGNVVEQRNETPNEKPNEKPNVVVTSMMIVDKNTAGENLYQCTVKHESGNEKTTSKILEKEKKVSTKEVIPKATCPPIPEKTLQRQISAASEQMPSLYLFVYAYGIMLMKNGVYFCAIFIFLLKRKFGKKE